MQQSDKVCVASRYIPFKKYHIAELSDLSPEAIKSAARTARKKYNDREELKQSTALNFISKKLGATGGFAGYSKLYQSEIKPFMDQYGLKHREDLIKPRCEWCPSVNISPAQIADQLFLGHGKQVTRLFTGYDVDWAGIDAAFYKKQQRSSFMNISNPIHRFDLVEQCNSLIREHPFEEDWYPEHPANEVIQMIRVHLISDSRSTLAGTYFPENEFTSERVLALYCDNTYALELHREDRDRLLRNLEVFRKWMAAVPMGWVDVLRFNDNLIFLRGADGAYDFLIRKAKDRPFVHQVGENLKQKHTPKSNDAYHYNRWLYFEYDGWKEMDAHKAEELHYAKGGTAKDYPQDALKQYLIDQGVYTSPEKTASPSDAYQQPTEDFHRLTLGGRGVYVSDLISIDQFSEFMKDPQCDYRLEREEVKNVECWKSPNQNSSDLPASVTWCDANAYAAWVSQKCGLPVRLLKESEYYEMYKQAANPYQFKGWLYAPHCDIGPGLEGWIAENSHLSEYELTWNSTFRCEQVQHPGGVTICRNYRFGEWINERGCVVNTAFLGSLVYPELSAQRAYWSETLTGEYKLMRIGFRLCYLADAE
ncbi:SUMF1/EgtB/PvdO family nonheme iron enzyme [Coraliomargarita sp. SDUM461003]|uniref:SUMF1/EgtB/PvdO family nonheme iron enzyme n=1 Tax=Thalassobacterium maritimum TaxID=3041265 RepID=A0ABU1ARS1_9BACT|nr:SUMF1/EgtB/PvdO family nonheme iron enzyme [Coraliomargarita sp. SDUM461003]MDQ8206858.1 SUMF1/EgtB/PvdO family nonheme iron enzyme [Coraliomargarita sp. SDUM461003]